MAQIKVNVKAGANASTICDELLAAAKAAMPASTPRAAEVIRDSNGKVVQLKVNLPDGDAAGLVNARNSINSNAGVSSSSEFPKVLFDRNFDELAENALIADSQNPIILGSNGAQVVAGSVADNNRYTTVFRAAYAEETPSGTGSAIASYTTNKLDEYGISQSIWLRDFRTPEGLVSSNMYELSFDAYYPKTTHGVPTTNDTEQIYRRIYHIVLGNGNSLDHYFQPQIRVRRNAVDPDTAEVGAASSFDPIAVPTDGKLSIRLVVNPVNATLTVNGESFTISDALTPNYIAPHNPYMSVQDFQAKSSTLPKHAPWSDAPPVVVDNLKLILLG